MPLYHKAYWTAFKAFAKDKCEELVKDHPSKSVEDLWSFFKSVIHNGIAKFVPSKTLGTKKSLLGLHNPLKDLLGRGISFFISRHPQKVPLTVIIF